MELVFQSITVDEWNANKESYDQSLINGLKDKHEVTYGAVTVKAESATSTRASVKYTEATGVADDVIADAYESTTFSGSLSGQSFTTVLESEVSCVSNQCGACVDENACTSVSTCSWSGETCLDNDLSAGPLQAVLSVPLVLGTGIMVLAIGYLI